MTFAENEERSVWEPFHVRKGFKKEESTVSVFQGWSAINSMGAAGCFRPAQEEMLIIMQAFPCLRGAITLVMDPLTAKHLKEQGFDDPAQLSKYLSENFQMPAGQFWGADVVYSLVEPIARSGMEPFASWLKLPRDEMIKPYHDPGAHQHRRGRRRDPGHVAHHRHVAHARPSRSTGGGRPAACTRRTSRRPAPRRAPEAARGGAHPQRLRPVAAGEPTREPQMMWLSARIPPSTASFCPVMKADSSEARKT